ncbi:MAG: restriction endonuclease [Chloroflexi bacterium]|nr:restriction endonuclease [Chloroflexota bacterium]MCL5107927.1 restriction endonuclease [Chloroflexota bacterium]
MPRATSDELWVIAGFLGLLLVALAVRGNRVYRGRRKGISNGGFFLRLVFAGLGDLSTTQLFVVVIIVLLALAIANTRFGFLPFESEWLLVVGFSLAIGVVADSIWHWSWSWFRERRDSAALRSRTATLADLVMLTPAEFERRIENLLRGLGFDSVEHVGRSGDLGVDVKCRAGRERVAVQCKKYSPGRNVGSKEVQQFYGMMRHPRHGATRGIFITTSGFTPDAAGLAEDPHLVLLDGQALVNLINRPGGNDDGDSWSAVERHSI